eukprot:TRINITY_DN74810_c0_g1_i1.p1 TRINITY_DN74810_c0_g1~~TRINITY_DN74810_c0_g1_i1.p1  ORF type:complete len:603 (+),score=52.54 TRINITY_DN74810_c0_g1_i1:43-1851(+)
MQIDCLQKDALVRLLRGGTPDDKIEWKVFVYDNFCRDVIAPLLKVGDLRKLGITLHMPINGERHPIRDAPCIYLIQPTQENVQRFCQDCKDDLYATYLLNFISPISRVLLEYIATELLSCPNVVPNIKIFDQYLNYVSLEEDMFGLQLPKSYQFLHAPQSEVSDQDIANYSEMIVSGLTSVLVTMQIVPIIVSVKGGAAQALADLLSAKLADLLRERQLQPSQTAHRIVLFLCDRDTDIPVCLAHTWTYRGLLHDALNMNLNKVELQADAANEKPKVMELDRADKMWKEMAGQEVDTVMARVDTELKSYTEKQDKFKSEHNAFDEDMEAVGALLKAFPELKDLKRYLDVHVSLNHALLGCIQQRKLDEFNGVSTQLVLKDSLDKGLFNKLVKDDQCKTSDRVRLLLIYYMTRDEGDSAAEKEVRELERLLADLNVNMSALQYLRGMRTLAAPSRTYSSSSSSSSSAANFLGSFGKAMKVKLDSAGEELKNTLRSQKLKLNTLTQMVQAILADPQEGKPDKRNKILESLYCVDPKTSSTVDLTRYGFNEAVVFTVGGGNYVEYQNLKAWEKLQPQKTVLYGSTEIVNGEQFLAQLEWLGSRSQ